MKNIPIANATYLKISHILGFSLQFHIKGFYWLFLKKPNPKVSCSAVIYHEYQTRSHRAPNGVHGSVEYHRWYQTDTLPEWQPLCRFPNVQEITPGLLTVLTSLFLMPLSSLEGSIVWKWISLRPAPLNDFEVLCTLQRRNLVSAVPVLISPKSFRCSALLEIKLITINDIEGWEVSLHGSPYSSIFHIKFKWKFSCVRWEDCWKGSSIFKKTWETQLN